MTTQHRIFGCSVILAALITLAPIAGAQPPGGPWWPSEWGPDDQRGAANRLTPAKVLEAAALIDRGVIYQLGRVYEQGMPMVGNRHIKLTIPGLPTAHTPGGIVYNDEMFSGEIGQIGTQFDGLGHIGRTVDNDYIFYNGFKLSEFGTSYGLTKLGVENVGVILTRGVLLDVARYKRVARLEPSYIITVADIEGTLAMEGVDIREADAVLFHTGWGQLWNVDNAAYGSNEPGPGITAIKWLADKKIVMTGADNYATEAVPGEHPETAIEGHEWLLTRHGIYNLENLDLSGLATDRVYEFAFMFAPMKLKGATGAPGNPIAVR